MNDKLHEHLRQIERLFQEAADLPPERRDTFLDAADVDATVRERVEAMLEEMDGDSLDQPPFIDVDDPVVFEGPGTVIGRYKLLQKIGEGGFGVVYMAEQREPMLRKVALKVVKLGMDTKEVVARFEAERQALAMMDHPNIARVLDAGSTAAGRPYFVMELVRGISITDYCDQNKLETVERLALFESVCHAVQHAHSKGVIHRDIKPNNVLVTLHDTGPVPKVIDFGIAKAIHTPLTEKTLFTNFRHFIGTPAYMSPEQAAMSALDVDTRTDIYSLGVLLYELLTGTTPFDVASLMEKGFDEVKRIVREEEPPKPSLRISSSRDADIAHRRGADSETLSRYVRGDLDWIVLKALAKDRARRYATAHEFAADVGRHLRREPVSAGPPTTSYRLRKFVVRNRAAVISTALIASCLVAGIIGTSLAMIEAGKQRDEAIDASRRAAENEREAMTAREEEARQRARAVEQVDHYRRMMTFLDETVGLADPEVGRDPNLSVRSLLERASARVATTFTDQPAAEARLRRTLGYAFSSLGKLELAERHLRRSAELTETLDDADAMAHYNALWRLTEISFRLDRPDAFAIVAWATRVGYAHLGSRHPDLAERLGAFFRDLGIAAQDPLAADVSKLRRAFDDVVRLANGTLSDGDPKWSIVSDTYMSAGYNIWHTPLEPEAVRFFEAALTVQRRELSPRHPRVAETLSQLVGVLNRAGRATEAETRIRQSLELTRSIYPEGSWQIAFAQSTLGECLVEQQRFAEAEPELLAADKVMRSVWGDTNFYPLDSANRIVRLYDGWGRSEKASPYREYLARGLARSYYVAPWPLGRHAFDSTDSELITVLDALEAECGAAWGATKKMADAAKVTELFDRLVASHDELLRSATSPGALLGRYLVHWTRRLDLVRDVVLRERMARHAVAAFDAGGDDFALEEAQARAILADSSHRRGDDAVTEREVRAVLRLLRLGEPPDSWWLAAARIEVAPVLIAVGRWTEATSLLRASREKLVRLFGPTNPTAKKADVLLADLQTTPSESRRLR